MNEDKSQISNPAANYITLKKKLEDALIRVATSSSFMEAKAALIEVQGDFKGLILDKEDREELWLRLQEAFRKINERMEEESSRNYLSLKTLVNDTVNRISGSNDFRNARELLKALQAEIRNVSLLKDQRDELNETIQDAFVELNIRQDEDRELFEREAKANYDHLKILVAQGMTQAEETHQYKETREFLKKIQSGFKGTKLIREQREELYSRLQTAFDILNKRLDEYFRQKKKNWEVKMNYKLSGFSTEIFEQEDNLKKEQAYLKELEDQLDIVRSAGKDKKTVAALEVRIESSRISIERMIRKINTLQGEMLDLKSRLDQEV